MSSESHHSMATVLVISGDPNIETLLGELVAFAGHRPIYDVTIGAAGESIRRSRPEVVLLDMALSGAVAEACIGAADEVGSVPVLVSSTASADEIVAQARSRGRLYFPLPSGPRPLSRVIERAVARAHDRPVGIPVIPHGDASESVHPAFCAALTRVASARVKADAHRGLGALRAAITDYTRQLKAASVPMEDVLRLVRHQIRDCAEVVGVKTTMNALLRDSETWAQEAYDAA